MSVTININGLTLCHKGSGGVTHNTLPDVCKTPDKGIPRPFDNEAYSRDLANGTISVFADGGHMIANFGSIFAKSSFDGGGSLGGIKSGTFLAEAEFMMHSPSVFFEGKPACRLTDKMWMNHKNTVNMSGLNQIDLKARDRLCDAVCYCSNTVRATAAANTSLLSMDFWIAGIQKSGGIPTPSDMVTRTQQECVAKQFSSGWPLYEPHADATDILAEASYDFTQTPFKLLTSTSDPMRTLPNGYPAPMSPMKAMGNTGLGKVYAPGTTFRPDFVMLKNPALPASGANVERYIDIKFKGDKLTENQEIAKAKLEDLPGEEDKFLVIKEEECCGESEVERATQKSQIKEAIEKSAASARKVMGLFFPPGLGGLPKPGF